MCSNLPQTLSSSEEDEVTKKHNHKGSKQKKSRKFIDSGMETGFIFLSILRCCCYFENVLLYLSSSSKLQEVIEFNFRVPYFILSFLLLLFISFITVSAGVFLFISRVHTMYWSYIKHLPEDSRRSQHADLLGLCHISSLWYSLDVFLLLLTTYYYYHY